jgi:non-specific serine/threonine protein kinase/serine/threonine-protein kinase
MDNELPDATTEAQRWARVRSALADCLELTGPARDAFIAQLRETDPGIAAEVDELVAIDDQTSSPLDRPPGELFDALGRVRAGRRLEGTRLGAWRIVRRIASGGMGDVFLGERADGAFQMQVAVKLLRDGLVNDADVARFARERQTLANLEHVNLVRILDGGVTEAGLPWFVMELVDGQPIDAWCERNAASLEQRVGLLRKVCEVVHYVNQRGVVHRDLKPSNILVTPAGVVKLVDFGIATRLPEPNATTEQTRTALRGMTILYASPEQVRGDPVGPESDVYALGVVMVRLLAGSQPYAVDPTTASSFEFARAICDAEPRRMSELVLDGPGSGALRRALRGDLDAIASKALRKDRTTRYHSAAELDDDLFRHLSRLPVQARRGALNYRFGRWLLQHRAFAGAAIVSNLVLLAGIGVTLAEVHETNVQRQRANRNFDSVRALANDFLFALNDAVSTLPGSMPARKLVVEKAQTYLRTLAEQSWDDPTLALDLGVSYRKLGDLQDLPAHPNLGDRPGAMASYGESIRLLKTLEDMPPATADRARLELARTYLSESSVQSYNAKYDDAIATLTAADASLADLARRSPDDAEVQRLRGSVYGGLSWEYHEKGDLPSFEKHAAQGEAILERLVAAHPDDTDALGRLQAAYARRASDYSDRPPTPQNRQLALQYAQKWVDIGKRLLARRPDDPRYLAIASEAEMFLGQAYAQLGDARKAGEIIGQGIAQTGRELALDPADDAALQMMTDLHATLAKVQLDAHDPGAARENAQQALDFYARRTETARANTYNLLAAAQAHHVAAQAWRESAQHAGAAEAAADRGQSCREVVAAEDLVHRVKDMPQAPDDEYDLGAIHREAAACRGGRSSAT